jgi:phosphate starvation-inducible PhoH-like protein
LSVPGNDIVELLGQHNAKLNLVKRAFPDVKISFRGNTLRFSGDKKDTQEVKSVMETMHKILKKEGGLSMSAINDLLGGNNPYETYMSGDNGYTILQGRTGRPIRARTKNQKLLVESSNNNDIVFAVGPAGTGKTYTAVALAVRALKMRHVKKIILTRPAVEAGESLGFLPGDLKDKIDPYLRPLYDALDDMIPAEKLDQYMATRVIEVAPLAFMRGRTLDNAFIILDEAQNATTLQIKMFLTRLGPSAKCIITGDLSQIDLPFHQKSGLRRSIALLDGTKGIGVIQLTADDVVRHRLVKEIIMLYDKDDNRRRELREKEQE